MGTRCHRWKKIIIFTADAVKEGVKLVFTCTVLSSLTFVNRVITSPTPAWDMMPTYEGGSRWPEKLVTHLVRNRGRVYIQVCWKPTLIPSHEIPHF